MKSLSVCNDIDIEAHDPASLITELGWPNFPEEGHDES